METQLSLPQKGGTVPHFSAHVYCGLTARWIKRPLGVEAVLGLGNIVFDADAAPPLTSKW